jgi:hypothetical protein
MHITEAIVSFVQDLSLIARRSLINFVPGGELKQLGTWKQARSSLSAFQSRLPSNLLRALLPPSNPSNPVLYIKPPSKPYRFRYPISNFQPLFPPLYPYFAVRTFSFPPSNFQPRSHASLFPIESDSEPSINGYKSQTQTDLSGHYLKNLFFSTHMMSSSVELR